MFRDCNLLFPSKLFTYLVDICTVTFIISLAVRFSTGWRSFYGLLIVFVTWMLLYLMKDIPNDQVMSSKMANLFNFKNAYSLFIVISLIMGIVGGLASTAAYYIRKR